MENMRGNGTFQLNGSALLPYEHPFWSTYPPPPREVNVIVGTFVLAVSLITIAGNSFVIGFFCRCKSLRTPANFLLMNLSLSNVLMSVSVPMVTVASYLGEWPFGEIGCNLHAVMMGGFGLMTINTMAAIAVEKHHSIVKSQTVVSRVSWRLALKYLAIVWVNSIIWVLPPLFGWGRYILEGLGTACCFDYITETITNRAFVVTLFAAGFICPLSVIVVCYIWIFAHVHNNSHAMKTYRMSSQRKKRISRSELKIVKMILVVLMIYIGAWTPYAVVSLMGIFGKANQLDRVTSTIPAMVAKASAIYNPLVYIHYHRRFRGELRRRGIFPCSSASHSSAQNSSYGSKSDSKSWIRQSALAKQTSAHHYV
ncbi:rhodopsin, GQ-coupled-like [Lingula anatina]|uniref:Rhodopsin, GQ-coupled-like n=1 Tax=Lingula anatina TaxID=7574 RepID=A0A1S3JHW3_LINAN|nr:rhodopsin, GQ-coupled-like [Lingula anatina]|eukprot:XP_013409489.1 rhodopsin, GQ-coupled-like [Lingula anatina]